MAGCSYPPARAREQCNAVTGLPSEIGLDTSVGMARTIRVESHPLLDAGAFAMHLANTLVLTETPAAFAALAQPNATAPLAPSESVKTAVRDLLRHGGFK